MSDEPIGDSAAPLLEGRPPAGHFPVREGLLVDRTVGYVHAVDDVSLTLGEGETLASSGSRAAASRR